MKTLNSQLNGKITMEKHQNFIRNTKNIQNKINSIKTQKLKIINNTESHWK